MDETRARTWKSLRLPTDPAGTGAEEAEAGSARPSESVSGTFIESGAVFEGTLKLKGDFRIDSEFRGELTTDGVIVVGPSGSVVGDIKARQVEIQGAVVGDVTARRLFLLRASGRLHGNIESACVEIERHAFFQGGTTMTQPLTESVSSDAVAGAGNSANSSVSIPGSAPDPVATP